MMVKTRKKTLIRCSKILVNSPLMKIVDSVSGSGEAANVKLEDLTRIPKTKMLSSNKCSRFYLAASIAGMM